MKHFRNVSILAIALVLTIVGNSVFAAGLGNTIAVRLLGTATAYPSTDLFDAYGVDSSDSLCWDFALIDIKTGNLIGDVTDCAEVVDDDESKLIGTTFFYFPGGTIVSQVKTTVQPVTHEPEYFTHITGAIPELDDNNVIYGDGKFKNAEGPVRLSGAVNLRNLDMGEITIDCLFTLDVGPTKRNH